jgi:hypothetical protein
LTSSQFQGIRWTEETTLLISNRVASSHSIPSLSSFFNRKLGRSHRSNFVPEVKGIYASLVMVEAKCVEVDDKQAMLAQIGRQSKLNNEQWQAFIAPH